MLRTMNKSVFRGLLLAVAVGANVSFAQPTPQPAPTGARARTTRPPSAADVKAARDDATRLRKAGRLDEAASILDAMVARLDGATGADAALASVLSDLGWVHGRRGALAAGEAALRRALAIRERIHGPDDPRVADVLEDMAFLYKDAGAAPKAESVLGRALSIRMAAQGAEHEAVATTLQTQALVYSAMRRYADAVAARLRALAILEKKLGADHEKIAFALGPIALDYALMRDFARAEAASVRALAIWGKRGNEEEAARELTFLGAMYQDSGDYARALSTFERLLATREHSRPADHPDIAYALISIGQMHLERGDYARAEPVVKRAVAIYERAGDPTRLAGALMNIGKVYMDVPDLARAQASFERARELLERSGKESADLATALDNLAQVHEERGAYAAAGPLLSKALAIREKLQGRDGPSVATSLSNIGSFRSSMGDFGRARDAYERALAIAEKRLGREHPEVAGYVNNLAASYADLGDSARAQALYERSLAIREKALGPEHPQVATSLENLASHVDAAKAEPLRVRALAIREKAQGPEHPDVLVSIKSLASLRFRRGDHAGADALFARAIAGIEKALGPKSELLAGVLYARGGARHERQNLAGAEADYRRALAIVEAVHSEDHADTVPMLQSLARVAWGRRDIAQAVALTRRANEAREKQIVQVLASGSEEQRRMFLATATRETDYTLTLHARLAPDDRDARRLALTTALRRKGRVLDAMVDTMAAVRERMTAGDRAMLDELSSLRAQMTKRALTGGDVRALREQADALEGRIAAQSSEFRAASEPVTLEKVQQKLPRDAALVEIVRYFSLDAPYTDRYAAYVLRASGEPRHVDLGEAREIDELAADLRKRLASPDEDPRGVARRLDARVLEPLRPLLAETPTVLVAPDGPLSLVPFAALIDERGQPALGRFAISYLTTGRDLLRLGGAHPSPSPPLVIAAPDFGTRASGAPPPAADGSVDLRRATFAPLPGTEEEGRAVAALLGPAAQAHFGADADKRVLRDARAPEIVHVATHGFFLAERGGAARGGARALELEAAPADARTPENPLLRAGLVFAGANARADDSTLLTALEVSGLDLRGTKLVVLSACETGVGETRTGEGVYGLRRALVIAGAESQVMSLWKVDDVATRDLMKAYYGRLEKGGGRSEALRQAQIAMLHGEHAHPYFWAAFIETGDWRTLDGKDVPVVADASPSGAVRAAHVPTPAGCGCEAVGSGERTLHGLGALLAIAGLFVRGATRRRRREPEMSSATRYGLPAHLPQTRRGG